MFILKVTIPSILIFSILIIDGQNEINLPGPSSCMYLGSVDEKCDLPVVQGKSLPPECSSFIFDGLTVDLAYNIKNTYNLTNDSVYLENVISVGKPVFQFYGQNSERDWIKVLSCNTVDGGANAKEEMVSLQNYLNKQKGISGLILQYIDIDIPADLTNFGDNFKIYLDTIKSTFQNLSIGLNINGNPVIDSCSDPTKCLDFSILDPSIDFYVINLLRMNECSNKLIDGTDPLTGDAPYTIDKIRLNLEAMKIPASKMYYYFMTTPVKIADDFNIDICNVSYTTLCTHSVNSSELCADTQQSFFDKGKYIADNKGGGFIVDIIDLNDPNGSCKCEKSYPAFYYLLNGYNGGVTGPPCPLFDKQP